MSLKKNINPIQLALGDKNNQVEIIDWNPHHSGQTTIITKDSQIKKYQDEKFKSKKFKVPCETVDDFVKKNIQGRISLIKLDVEGYKRNVLEDWFSNNSKDSYLKKDLKNLGYTLFLTLDEQPKNLMLPSNLLKRLINLIYKSLYVILKVIN